MLLGMRADDFARTRGSGTRGRRRRDRERSVRAARRVGEAGARQDTIWKTLRMADWREELTMASHAGDAEHVRARARTPAASADRSGDPDDHAPRVWRDPAHCGIEPKATSRFVTSVH
jgi:hypothetical protein